MINYYYLLLLLFSIGMVQGQEIIGTYVSKGKSKKVYESYYVCKLRIISDSKYIVNYYVLDTKEQYKYFKKIKFENDYKNSVFIPITFGGTYLRKDNQLIFNGDRRNYEIRAHINKNQDIITFLHDWENNKLGKKERFNYLSKKSGLD